MGNNASTDGMKLVQAVSDGNTERVLRLVRRDPGLLRMQREGASVLHLVCARLQHSMLQQLCPLLASLHAPEIAAKVVNHRNGCGKTALMLLVTRACETPLSYATSSEQEPRHHDPSSSDVVCSINALVALAADVTKLDTKGQNLLHMACRGTQAESVAAVVARLLELPLDVSARSQDNLTPLDWALLGKHDVATKLLEARRALASEPEARWRISQRLLGTEYVWRSTCARLASNSLACVDRI